MYEDTIIGYDTTFELNEFNEPRIRSEIETVLKVVLFILFSKPGQYPSIPFLGMNIRSMLYSYYDEIDTQALKNKLIKQCEALEVFFSSGNIDIRKKIYKGKPSLIIGIKGTESFPHGYKKNHITKNDNYLIGISFDEMNKMIYDIQEGVM